MELLNLSKIQRSQEPSVDDDSEGRKSDDGDQEDIYTERVGEEAQTDLTRKAVSSAFRKVKKDKRTRYSGLSVSTSVEHLSTSRLGRKTSSSTAKSLRR